MPLPADGSESWLLETADAILAAGIEPERWRDIPARLAEGWPGAKVFIQGWSRRGGGSLGLIQHGFDADQMREYDRYYSRINPWVPILQQLPVLAASPSDETLPWWALTGTEFYNDFLKRQEETEHGVAIKLFDEPDRCAWVSFQFGHSVAERYNSVLPEMLDKLAPALRAALRLNEQLRLRAEASVASVLAAMDRPAFVLDARGTLRLANAAAEAALSRADIVRLDGRRRVRLKDADAGAALAENLRRICAAGTALVEDIAVRSTRGRALALLSLSPLVTASPTDRGLSSMFAPERLAILFLRAVQDAPEIPGDALRRLFGLTAAETRLALRLATGEALHEAAEALGVSKETVRTHLHGVFAKTGTHRQSELVALLGRLSRR